MASDVVTVGAVLSFPEVPHAKNNNWSVGVTVSAAAM
jgi:hypothetical protein